jgi:hypothetical protein
MENSFLDTNKKLYISNLIRNNILKNLNKDEFDLIIYYLYKIIEFVVIRFNIDNFNNFWHQLVQNNNRDIIAFFNLLLPYIDDKGGSYELHNQIFKLKDISCKRKSNIDKYDKSLNQYLISNIQYNLYIDKEVEYLKEHIGHNYQLLLETINRISNKLYVNWLNVIPITLKNYKQTNIYKESIFLDESSDVIKDIKGLLLNGKKIDIDSQKLNLKDTYFSYLYNRKGANNETLGKLFNVYSSDKTIDYDKLFRLKGISMCDIFQTIYYDLFLSVVKLKWLIFQDTFDDFNKDEIYIKKFNEYIAVPELYLNIKWDEIVFTHQLLFINKWKIFLEKVNISFKSTTRSGYFYLLRRIIIDMENNYARIDAICEEFGYEKLTKDTNFEVLDDDDIVDEDGEYINASDLIKRIKTIPIEEIYGYLLESIQQFMVTWYGKKIILKKNNEMDGVFIKDLREYKFNYNSYIDKSIKTNDLKKVTDTNIIYPEILTVKYKFIYNFAKAFVLIYQDKSKNIYRRPDWYNMDQGDRKLMVDLLNLSYIEAVQTKSMPFLLRLNVLSFAKYYERTYMNSDKEVFKTPKKNKEKKYNDKDKDYIKIGTYVGHILYSYIKEKLIDIVFECLIMKGLLSELIFNRNLTDNSIVKSFDMRYTNIKRYVLSDKQLDEYKQYAYYFINDKLYGDMYEIHIKNKSNYFDLLTSDLKWYAFYAMDWVAQINFFHRYINNRIIYITGATGQGKSTQVPKLFLYALKMIDNKINGRIICSQPRIKPSKDNATRISYELGLPIMEISSNFKKNINTYNPYIQYQTQVVKHIVNNQYGLLLKIVTDKILYNDLIRSPIFKELTKSYNENSIADSFEFYKYRKDNLYDIIIVDESHEHNINIDLILSIARDTVKFNNSLKLVIISATMDDDEYIYRKYYQEINDNFMYPYNYYNSNLNLSRIYVDRRIHISPPGETTQHVVKDIYLSYTPPDYEGAEKLAIQQVFNILKDSTIGDILFFSISKNTIKNICMNINKTLSNTSDIICLPFYRELPQKWEIFSDLNRNVKLITTHREDIFDDMYPNQNKVPRKVPLGTYKRVIIVATNIAEASITVDSLKFVIDTGYAISVSNDPYTMEDIVNTKEISETSRIQRRGRIGRVSGGIIYYMYKLGSKEKIKSEYSICTTNISYEIYELSSRIKKETSIISNNNFIDVIFKTLDRDKIEEFDKIIIDSKILKNLIVNQYTYLDILEPSILNCVSKKTHKEHISYDNLFNLLNGQYRYGFNIKETYNLISNRYIKTISGYTISTDLFDIFGDFYIIHPDEQNIKRNLLTREIISITKKDNIYVDIHFFISEKINIYFNLCFFNGLFVNNDLTLYNSKIFSENNVSKYEDLLFSYDKTIVGIIIQNMINKIDIKMSESGDNSILQKSIFMTIIYSYLCRNQYIVIMMIALLINSDFSLKNLNKNINIFKSTYGNDDLYIYYSLAKILCSNNKLFDFSNKEKIKVDFELEKSYYIDEKQKIIHNLKNNINYWNLSIPIEVYNKFNALDNQNKLNSDRNLFEYINETSKNITDEISNEFTKLLNSLSIIVNNEQGIKILKLYIELKNFIDNVQNKHKEKNHNNELIWFDYNFPISVVNDEYTNVKKAFICGFGLLQTIIYDSHNNSYLKINQLSKLYKTSKYTISPISDYAVYLKYDAFKDELYIIINSEFDTLVECNLYNYNPLFLDTLNYNININNRVFKKLLYKFISIHKIKYKFINFLKTYKYKDDKLQKIFMAPNNYTKYLIKLWKIELNESNLQYGGFTDNTIKINLNKLHYYLQQNNISNNNFLKFLKHKNIHIDNKYLYIKLK